MRGISHVPVRLRVLAGAAVTVYLVALLVTL
jgi:hypothetical protein